MKHQGPGLSEAMRSEFERACWTRQEYRRRGLKAVASSTSMRLSDRPKEPERKLRGIEIIESGGGHGGDAA